MDESETGGIVAGVPTFERPEIGQVLPGDCGGTLVRPDFVLTAAHCHEFEAAAPDPIGHESQRFEICTGPSDCTSFAVEAIEPFQSDPGALNNVQQLFGVLGDLALLRLVTPVGEDVARPAAIAAARPAWDAEVTMFGFGDDQRHWFTRSGDPLKRLLRYRYRGFTWGTIVPGDSGGPTTIGRHGPIFQISSYFDGLGIDHYVDLVAYGPEIAARIDAWEDDPRRARAHETEPNDDAASAPAIDRGQMLYGTAEPGRADWYRVVPRDGSITAQLVRSSRDVEIEVVSAAGEPLSSVRDFLGWYVTRTWTGAASEGAYVVVRTYPGSGPAPYRLSLH